MRTLPYRWYTDPDVLAAERRLRVAYGFDANWKVAVENYLECYHCAVAHPGFSAVVDVREGAYGLRAHPTFASHFARARDGDGQGQFHQGTPARPARSTGSAARASR